MNHRALWLSLLVPSLPCAARAASVLAPAASTAAAGGAYAAPLQQALPSTAEGLIRVTLALVVVLGAVLAAAWLSRRMRGVGAASAADLAVLAQVPLGPRERAVLVRVGSRRLLLGVAQGCVRTLHELDAAAAAPAAGAGPPQGGADLAAAGVPQRPSFKALLLKSLGR